LGVIALNQTVFL